jgi:hypothetical protein
MISRAPSLLILASLSLFALGTASAMAASGSATECAAAGGTYTKDGPNSVCVFPEEKVSSPNANPDNNASTTQNTSTGHGNLDNKTTTACTGVPGQCK